MGPTHADTADVPINTDIYRYIPIYADTPLDLAKLGLETYADLLTCFYGRLSDKFDRAAQARRLDEAEFELPSELDDECLICMDVSYANMF